MVEVGFAVGQFTAAQLAAARNGVNGPNKASLNSIGDNLQENYRVLIIYIEH